jgi:uncharacterized protein YjbI with pentapeptide repeats
MDKLTAKDLKRRYRAGERNFAGVDLSDESLRGMNLKGIDLSGADLSRTDIRGARFVNASLQRAQFTQARAGLQRRWLVGQLALTLTLAALFNFIAAIFTAAFLVYFFQPQTVEEIRIFQNSRGTH